MELTDQDWEDETGKFTGPITPSRKDRNVLKTGREAWEILKNFILGQRFLFSDNISISAILNSPDIYNQYASQMEGGGLISGLDTAIGSGAFEDGILTLVREGEDDIDLQLTFLEGDDLGIGTVGDVDDLLTGLHFGTQNIEAFWNGLDQGERDRVRASLWYSGFYGTENMPSFGQASDIRDNGALVNLADRMLQAGGTEDPLSILSKGEKEHTDELASKYKDSKSTAMRGLISGLYETDPYSGLTEADRMTADLLDVYEQETGLRLGEEQLKNAFDKMIDARIGTEISAENRYGADVMQTTDIFLGHYFNNGYYTPQWQQVMGRERLDSDTFVDNAVKMGLTTRQEARQLRNKYEKNFTMSPNRRDFDSEDMQRYLALEQQVIRESIAGIFQATGGDLLTSSYLFNEGIGNSFFTKQNMGYEDIQGMIDSTNAHLASGSDVVSMSPSDIANTPEDIARRALIGANVNLDTGHKAAGAAKALAQGMVQGWGINSPYDYRSVT